MSESAGTFCGSRGRLESADGRSTGNQESVAPHRERVSWNMLREVRKKLREGRVKLGDRRHRTPIVTGSPRVSSPHRGIPGFPMSGRSKPDVGDQYGARQQGLALRRRRRVQGGGGGGARKAATSGKSPCGSPETPSDGQYFSFFIDPNRGRRESKRVRNGARQILQHAQGDGVRPVQSGSSVQEPSRTFVGPIRPLRGLVMKAHDGGVQAIVSPASASCWVCGPTLRRRGTWGSAGGRIFEIGEDDDGAACMLNWRRDRSSRPCRASRLRHRPGTRPPPIPCRSRVENPGHKCEIKVRDRTGANAWEFMDARRASAPLFVGSVERAGQDRTGYSPL